MKIIDLTFPTPQENLACDEVLLDLCENGFNDEIIRFWEPAQYFIVLGYSNKFQSEVDFAACRKNHIPILRRPSGGGTVLQGPGCLIFSLILKIDKPSLQNITRSNTYILERHQKALQALTGQKIGVQGFTDLTLENLKFSGNSQRRKLNHLLFHGSFLLNMDIALIEQLLLLPQRQPDYRQNRSHTNFLTNLKAPSHLIKDALKKVWGAENVLNPIPLDQIKILAQEKYSQDSWNFKF